MQEHICLHHPTIVQCLFFLLLDTCLPNPIAGPCHCNLPPNPRTRLICLQSLVRSFASAQLQNIHITFFFFFPPPPPKSTLDLQTASTPPPNPPTPPLIPPPPPPIPPPPPSHPPPPQEQPASGQMAHPGGPFSIPVAVRSTAFSTRQASP